MVLSIVPASVNTEHPTSLAPLHLQLLRMADLCRHLTRCSYFLRISRLVYLPPTCMTISIGVRLTVRPSPSLRSLVPVIVIPYVGCSSSSISSSTWCPENREADDDGIDGGKSSQVERLFASLSCLTREADDDKIARPVARRCGVGLFNCTVGCCCCIFRPPSLSLYVSLLCLLPFSSQTKISSTVGRIHFLLSTDIVQSYPFTLASRRTRPDIILQRTHHMT